MNDIFYEEETHPHRIYIVLNERCSLAEVYNYIKFIRGFPNGIFEFKIDGEVLNLYKKFAVHHNMKKKDFTEVIRITPKNWMGNFVKLKINAKFETKDEAMMFKLRFS